MARIATGWRLTKTSWAVLKADRSLAVFPVLSFLSAAVAFVLLITPGVALAAFFKEDWRAAPFALAGSYAATFFTVYFNVALAAAASMSLDGRDTTLRDGLAVARERRSQIAAWAFVQWIVGLVIHLIDDVYDDNPVMRILGKILSRLLGAAWAIATFFIVPVLALEGLGPGAAMKRSMSLIRERWGEGFVGNEAIGFSVFLVSVVPLGALLLVGYESLDTAPALAAAAFALGGLGLIAVGVVGSALGVIFRVALYRYATAGASSAGFAQGDLASAFERSGRR